MSVNQINTHARKATANATTNIDEIDVTASPEAAPTSPAAVPVLVGLAPLAPLLLDEAPLGWREPDGEPEGDPDDVGPELMAVSVAAAA